MTEAFSVNSILGTDANEKENQGIMWNETMIIRALNYFYDQEESERVVIYPESADLLWDIVDSEYHLDGLDISQCLNNFVLMMPTNYESYEHLGFKGSYYVSVTSEMEMDARSYESCSKFFKKQGLPGTSWAWEQKQCKREGIGTKAIPRNSAQICRGMKLMI